MNLVNRSVSAWQTASSRHSGRQRRPIRFLSDQRAAHLSSHWHRLASFITRWILIDKLIAFLQRNRLEMRRCRVIEMNRIVKKFHKSVHLHKMACRDLMAIELLGIEIAFLKNHLDFSTNLFFLFAHRPTSEETPAGWWIDRCPVRWPPGPVTNFHFFSAWAIHSRDWTVSNVSAGVHPRSSIYEKNCWIFPFVTFEHFFKI